MIKRIFWDNDETLSHSTLLEPGQACIAMDDNVEGQIYFTIVRPSAKELLEFSRDLVGDENVFMLTTAIKDHAMQVSEKAGFGFKPEQIHHRGSMWEFRKDKDRHQCYECEPNPLIADPQNVLIDNLPHYYNDMKKQYIGIDSDRYLRIRDYYGVNDQEQYFVEDVKQFLLQKYNEV